MVMDLYQPSGDSHTIHPAFIFAFPVVQGMALHSTCL